jgi:hypothetical protein
VKIRPFVALCLGAAIACTAVRAEAPPDPDVLRSDLAEMLSLLSLGSVSVAGGAAQATQPGRAPQVTQSGNDFHIQLPLSGFVAPAGATAEAVAHAAANGVWDVTSMTVPSAGALGTSIDQVISYTIARQAMHGRFDRNLATPSTFAADLGAITLQSASGARASEQAIERITLDGSISGTPGGRVDLLARNSARGWHAVTRDTRNAESDSLVRRVEGHASLTGLDRTRGLRFIAAVRSIAGMAKAWPGQPDLSPAARDGLRDMLEATDGLLTRVEAEETLDGLTFDFGGKTGDLGGRTGTLGRMQLRVTGDSEGERLNAGMDIALDELSLTTLSPDSAAFLPHHVTARSVLAGLPVAPLRTLLRAAIAPGADPGALQKQATALLAVPGAQVGMESIAFDVGPMHVRGSTRFVPRANGEIGADIHISATGVDALVAQVNARPNVQGFMPMVFLAKGLGRVQGDSIVWDIGLGGGPLTVNGVPFGQPAGKTR